MSDLGATPEAQDASVERSSGEPQLLKLSEVRRQTGVSVESLRLLIDDKMLSRGLERARNGHVYLRADSVPAYGELVEILERQLRRNLESSRQHLRRVEVEMEAVRNDVELALEDPDAPLGHDLVTLRARSSDPRASSLTSALGGLEMSSSEVRRYYDAVAEAKAVGPGQLD